MNFHEIKDLHVGRVWQVSLTERQGIGNVLIVEEGFTRYAPTGTGGLSHLCQDCVNHQADHQTIKRNEQA